MLAQQKVVFSQNKSLKNKEFDAVIEGYLSEDGVYIGRTYRDAPDIDGYIFIESKNDLVLGNIVRVKVKSASGYDLTGCVIE